MHEDEGKRPLQDMVVMQDEAEGEHAGDAADALVEDPAAAATPAAGEYKAPPLPDREGFSADELKLHVDPLTDADGVVRPGFLPPPAPDGKHRKYVKWYRLLLFLRTWSTVFNLPQRAAAAGVRRGRPQGGAGVRRRLPHLPAARLHAAVRTAACRANCCVNCSSFFP